MDESKFNHRVCRTLDGEILFEYEYTGCYSLRNALVRFFDENSSELEYSEQYPEGYIRYIHYNLDLSSTTVYSDECLEGLCLMLSDLHGSSFRGSDLYWGCLCDNNLENVDFCGCDLRGVSFARSNLRNALFDNADIGFANMGRGADFSGADLTGTSFHNTTLLGAIYDSKTTFSKDFTIPTGMIFRYDHEDSDTFIARAMKIKGTYGDVYRTDFNQVPKASPDEN